MFDLTNCESVLQLDEDTSIHHGLVMHLAPKHTMGVYGLWESMNLLHWKLQFWMLGLFLVSGSVAGVEVG